MISEPERSAASTTTHAERAAGDDPVAPREMPRLRLGADRHFGDQHAALGDRLVERAVLLGIDHVDAAGEHGHGAGRQRAFMRRRVDAARQPGNDDEPCWPSCEAMSRAKRRPLAEALRAPTTATARRASRSVAPHA